MMTTHEGPTLYNSRTKPLLFSTLSTQSLPGVTKLNFVVIVDIVGIDLLLVIKTTWVTRRHPNKSIIINKLLTLIFRYPEWYNVSLDGGAKDLV